MDVKSLLDEINLESTKWTSAASDKLITTFDISPQDFIKFAEIDLAKNYEHSVINALSNSKRALDCQLDTLLVAFGFYKISQAEFWNFPKKLTLISELGVIAPRVLHKINKQRNLLEHQFIRPPKESVEDFLDIAMLFIASTDRYSLKFISTLTFNNENLNKHFIVHNSYVTNSFQIKIRDIKSSDENDYSEIIVGNKDLHYKDVLKKYLKFY